jgi:hypothetical protein
MLEKVRNFLKEEKNATRINDDLHKDYARYQSEMSVERTWIHVDRDMFFAACEIREQPHLAHRPLAVGDYAMI